MHPACWKEGGWCATWSCILSELPSGRGLVGPLTGSWAPGWASGQVPEPRSRQDARGLMPFSARTVSAQPTSPGDLPSLHTPPGNTAPTFSIGSGASEPAAGGRKRSFLHSLCSLPARELCLSGCLPASVSLSLSLSVSVCL